MGQRWGEPKGPTAVSVPVLLSGGDHDSRWRWAPAGPRCCSLGAGPSSSRGAENWRMGRCPARLHSLPLCQARDLADSGSSGRTSDFGLGERQQWALRDSGPGGPQGGRRGRGHRGRVSGLPERPGPLEGTSAALDVMVLVAGCPHALTRGSGRLEEQELVTAGMEALGDRFCVTAGHR